MVALGGITYRIERLASKTYAVVRVSDDTNVGTFKTTGGVIQVFPEAFDPDLLEMIARTAVKTAKTSWVNHPIPDSVPPPAPEPESKPEAAEPINPRRRWVPA
jgi:hypothetical protein